MRSIVLKVFLLSVVVMLALQTYAQTCTGSLGDPVIFEDFGSGANPGPPLGSAVTNYTYQAGDCPPDGSYTIANRTSACFGASWYTVTQDNTKKPNGYMMIINASNAPGLFYTQRAEAGKLCANTTYEFAAFIMNVILPSACGGNTVQPNITFSIETPDGKVLQTYNTGNIPPENNAPFKKYGTFFTMPAEVTDVIVKMINNAPGGCGNDLILDDITFRPCGPIIQAGFGAATASPDQNLCEGGNAAYTIKASVTGGDNPSYQWQSNSNGNGWIDIAGKTADFLDISFSNAITGTYQYRLGVGTASNISSLNCRVYSGPVTVNVTPLPVVPAIATQTVCESNTLTLTASGGATYQWSGPNLPSSSQNPLVINNVTPSNAGTYSVKVFSDKGCEASPVQAVVKVVPKVIAAVSNGVTICGGSATQLSASGGLYYKWTPATGLDHDDSPTPVATPAITTTYTVKVSNDGCYDDTKTVTVTVLNPPLADAGASKKIFEGQSVKLNGSVKGDDITSISWSPATNLDNPGSLTPLASPIDDITYTLTVTSKSCGISTSKVFVRVYKKVIIPNTFSPNNDGVNDYWNIEALSTYPESSIAVFNRFGNEVYNSIGYAKPWDGTFKGATLPEGTYYYVIDLKNNTPKLAGWVAIVK
jgi:gliding motility-associated-like protein